MMKTSSNGSTKDRLSSIVKGFDEFDKDMKVGTRKRRENEEIIIVNLKMVHYYTCKIM
jgi:hypothetical protein